MSDAQKELIGMTHTEKQDLMVHMALEEKREAEQRAALARGEKRMEKIEEDLQPLKKMYWAFMGCIVVGGALLSALGYIYHNDKEESRQDRVVIRDLQISLLKQGSAIEKQWSSHAELEKDYRRDMARIEALVASRPPR